MLNKKTAKLAEEIIDEIKEHIKADASSLDSNRDKIKKAIIKILEKN